MQRPGDAALIDIMMNMGNLFLSFSIAVAGAIGLVILSRALDLEFYTSRIFPLIPILYALVYQSLEKARTGKARPISPSQAKEQLKEGARKIFEHVTAGRILGAIGVSFAVKIAFETIFVVLYVRLHGQSFTSLYGTFGIETISRFLRGDHPWLTGQQGFYLLSLLAFATSFGTGVWIGYTSRGAAILEGVLAGAAVTFVTAMTNMLILYRKIEEMANQMATSMGYGMRIGFVVVIAVQILLYGLWAGLAEKAKQERLARSAGRKVVKKAKK